MSTIKLYSTQKGSANDYAKYLSDALTKTDRLNTPTLLDFSLVPSDATFESIRPHRGYYIKVETDTFGLWYTGFVTNEPELSYLGKNPATGLPEWGYKYEVTADDYILNLQQIGDVPVYTNHTVGEIVKDLVNRIAPGKFDVTGIQEGPVVAEYPIDRSAKFGQVIADLAARANFRFYAKDMKLYFEPQDFADAGLTIDGTDTNFTPSRLSISPTKGTITNDVAVVGEVEPQGYVSEYFVGDGFEGEFPLLADVFGADKFVLLDETFQGTDISTDKWAVNDPTSTFLSVSDGFLNVLGGNANASLDINLSGQIPFALEGVLRMTHGEFDFINANSADHFDGLIASLWFNDPSMLSTSSFPNCFYGIGVERASGSSKLFLVKQGARDGSITPVTIDFSKRYILRTVINFNKMNRLRQFYSFLDDEGAVNNVGGYGEADTADILTLISEVDPTTGDLVSTTQWVSTGVALTNTELFAYYFPVVSNDLHCTVTNITCSVPVPASLQVKAKGTTEWIPKLLGPNEVDSYDGLAPAATISSSGSPSDSSTNQRGTTRYNTTNAALKFFKNTATQTIETAGPGDLINIKYRRGGVAIGHVKDSVSIAAEQTLWGDTGVRSSTYKDLVPSPRTSEECELAAAAIVGDSNYQHYEGQYTTYSMFCTGEPTSGTVLKFLNLPTTTFPNPVQTPTGGDTNTYNFNEVITDVTTKLLAVDSQGELFEHVISFGVVDRVSQIISKFYDPQAKEQSSSNNITVPNAIDRTALSSSFAPDVTDPKFVSWDTDYLHFDTNQAAPVGGGFEVRYTDASWGVDDAKNLIGRFTTQTFQVPRNNRTKVAFIKAYDAAGKMSRVASAVVVHLPLIPPKPTATLDASDKLHPIVKVQLPTLLADVWGVEIRDSDNTTVLYRQSLADASYEPKFTYDNTVTKTRTLSFYLYTYNLLDEYSADVTETTLTIPKLKVINLRVDNDTKNLLWDFAEALPGDEPIVQLENEDEGGSTVSFATVRIEITGANPQTKTVNVFLTDDGVGQFNLKYTGVNHGIDTIQAFIDELSLSSNIAKVTWQGFNTGDPAFGQAGICLLNPVTAYVYNAVDGSGVFKLASAASPLFSQNFNSLMFNTHPKSLLLDFGNGSANQSRPMRNQAITTLGHYQSDIVVAGGGYQAGVGSLSRFYMILTGTFVVSKAGTYSFLPYSDDGYLGGIGGGATRISGPWTTGGYADSTTKKMGYPLQFAMNMPQSWDESSGRGPTLINFPSPGLYPFEFMYAQGPENLEFAVICNGGCINYVEAETPPSDPGAGSGPIIISPSLRGPLIMGDTVTFTLTFDL